jgi:hypothetical protein
LSVNTYTDKLTNKPQTKDDLEELLEAQQENNLK